FVKNRYAVILAAGQGTRMKSKLYKVLHPILGRPMIQYVVDALKDTKVNDLVHQLHIESSDGQRLYEVLYIILGRPMIQYVVDALKDTKVNDLVTVVGHGAEEVKKTIDDESNFVLQEEQLGTAHAVMQAEQLLENKSGTTIVVCG